MLNDHTINTEKVQVNPNIDDKIENGDLSAWEYLTTTFDNGETMIASERATVHHHPLHLAPIAESSENESSSRESERQSSSSSNLPETNPLFHQFYGNTLTSSLGASSGTEHLRHDHAYKMKKSWSYPIIRDQVEESNKYTIARQQEMFLSSNLTNTTNQIAYHPNQYPVAFLGTSEQFQQATGRSEYHEHCNQTNGQWMTNQSFLTSSYRNCTMDANSKERLLPIDYNSMASEYFTTTIAGQINTSLESPIEKSVATSCSIPAYARQQSIADDHLAATDDSKQPVKAHTRRTSNRSSPSKVHDFFAPIELNAIQSWIDLQAKSNILPYQQHLRKKLLLPPLTSYNYFFRDERDNIVSQIFNDTDPLPPPLSEVSVSKLQDLLSQHWYNDPLKKKRQHRKKHGKIDFQRLSKAIAERWHQLPQRVREFYRVVAVYDDIYYHQQLKLIESRPDIR